MWICWPWGRPGTVLDVRSGGPSTRDHRERERGSPFRFALAGSLLLYFAMEPTYNVWVGGGLLDSPCVLEK